jgi:hypothetical protein
MLAPFFLWIERQGEAHEKGDAERGEAAVSSQCPWSSPETEPCTDCGGPQRVGTPRSRGVTP